MTANNEDDLPRRLRRLADALDGDFVDPGAPREAADEIERLRARVRQLEAKAPAP